MMRFRAMLLASLVTSVAFAGARYDASLGTRPQDQGFIYSGDNNVNGTNPAPFVAGGALQENTTVGAQYWEIIDASINFAQNAVVEANLHIISSNYVANVGTGTREGYYLGVSDSGHSYSVGLAAAGFNINSVQVPNQPLTPYPFPITDTFHLYHLAIANGSASFSIDGVPVASNIPPIPAAVIGPASSVIFGGVAGFSRSVTELKSFCYSTGSAGTCAPSACSALTITALSATPNVLWPPNRQMVPVTVSGTTSGGCGAVSCKIISVSSNQPSGSNAVATGDAVITGDLTANLRAEVFSVYTITVQCTDGSGNSTTKTVVVDVVHIQPVCCGGGVRG